MNGNNAMITSFGYEISDPKLYEQERQKYGFKNILYIILKGKKEVNLCEQEALVTIAKKIRTLKVNIDNLYQKKIIDSFTYYDVLKHFECITLKIEKLYAYASLLSEQKKIAKNHEMICSQMNYLAKSIGPYKELQREKMHQTQLLDKYLESDKLLKTINKEIHSYKKSLEPVLARYEYNDYIQLLDTQIDNFNSYVMNLNVSNNFKELVSNWYKKMDEVMTEQTYIVGKKKDAFQKKCQSFGVEKREKDDIEKVIDIIQLFNPLIDINYDMFNKIYLETTNLNLPENCWIDEETKTINCQIENRLVKYPIYHLYTHKELEEEIVNLNPQVVMEIDNDTHTIYGSYPIEDLKLPMGFYTTNNGENTIITNQMILPNNNIKVNYERRLLSKEVSNLQQLEEFEPQLDQIKEVQEFNVFELVNELQKLNGRDNVKYYKGKILTTIKDVDSFKLPKGFDFDEDLNIVNETGSFKVAVKSIKNTDTLEIAKAKNSTPVKEKENVLPKKVPGKKVVKIEKNKVKNKASKKMLGLLKMVASFSGAVVAEGLNIVTYPLTYFTQLCKKGLDTTKEKFLQSMAKGFEEVFTVEKEIEKKLPVNVKKVPMKAELPSKKSTYDTYNLDDILQEYSREGRSR